MSRMNMVYNGKCVENLTKDQIIDAILNEFKIEKTENTIRVMEESFRCGFLRGEEYGKSCN